VVLALFRRGAGAEEVCQLQPESAQAAVLEVDHDDVGRIFPIVAVSKYMLLFSLGQGVFTANKLQLYSSCSEIANFELRLHAFYIFKTFFPGFCFAARGRNRSESLDSWMKK
jgi:hypothetical protein